MLLYKLITNEIKENITLEDLTYRKEFIVCDKEEFELLKPEIIFEENNIRTYNLYDYKVRFENLNGYDFINFVNMHLDNYDVIIEPLNIYISKEILVLIVTEKSENFNNTMKRIFDKLNTLNYKEDSIDIAKFYIFEEITKNISNIIENLEEGIYNLENEIYDEKYKLKSDYFETIIEIKQSSYIIRKYLRPLVYVIEEILVNTNKIILEENLKFFKSLEKKITKLLDFSGNLQDYANEAIAGYQSKVNMETNSALNKLTIVTAFTAPITIITGIYGMNFSNMPETQSEYGYFISLLIMSVITFSIYIFLKNKKLL